MSYSLAHTSLLPSLRSEEASSQAIRKIRGRYDRLHHLYLYFGIWYFCIQVPPAPNEKPERLRFSLRTTDEDEAVASRDQLIPPGSSRHTYYSIMRRYECLMLDAGPDDEINKRMRERRDGDPERWMNTFLEERKSVGETGASSLSEYSRSILCLIHHFPNSRFNLSVDQAASFRDLVSKSPRSKWYLPEYFGVSSDKFPPISPSTVKHIIRALGSFFEWLVNRELVPRNPWNKITLPSSPKSERTNFSVDIANKLCSMPSRGRCNPIEWKAAILAARYTGSRLSEICGLHGSEVDISLKIPTMTLVNEKQKKSHHNHDFRILPIPSQMLELMKQLLKMHGKGHLFPTLGYSEVKFNGAVEASYGGYFARLYRKSAVKILPNTYFHKWRTYASSALANARVQSSMRCRITGHSGSKADRDPIEALYVILDLTPIQEDMRKIP